MAPRITLAAFLLFALASPSVCRARSVASFLGAGASTVDPVDEKYRRMRRLQETPFQGAGPHDVTREWKNVDFDGHNSKVYTYEPSGPGLVTNEEVDGIRGAANGTQWPGVVFGHGLCSSAEHYDHVLTLLASWGYFVVATDEMSECGMETVGNLDTEGYRDELVRNFRWLQEQPNVNASRMAFAGHSMGGGGSVTAAAAIEETDPGAVKAVVGIAPWNGVQPTPSDVVGTISAPLLLFCSQDDDLTPCSGPVRAEVGLGGNIAVPLVTFLPDTFQGSQRVDWGGGVLEIFESAAPSTPAVLLNVANATHLSITDTDGKYANHLIDALRFGEYGLLFEFVDENQIIPTFEYVVSFLNWALGGDRASKELIWGPATLEDQRFVQPIFRSGMDF